MSGLPTINSDSFSPTFNPYVGKVMDQKGIYFSTATALQCLTLPRKIVDLGCGNGHFLSEYLSRWVDTCGLGVEKRFKRLYKTALKLERYSSTGGVLVCDVLRFLKECPAQTFDEVWWQFPDPWPKDRHAKHRMIKKESFLDAIKTLKPGGSFCFRSDCQAYWEELQAWAKELPHLSAEALQGDLFSNQVPKTLFQRKFENKKIPIFSLKFVIL